MIKLGECKTNENSDSSCYIFPSGPFISASPRFRVLPLSLSLGYWSARRLRSAGGPIDFYYIALVAFVSAVIRTAEYICEHLPMAPAG